MPQPTPGEARSPPLRLLPPGRPCEFPGCGGKDGRERGVRGCGAPCSPPSPRPVPGQPPPPAPQLPRPATRLRPRPHRSPRPRAGARPSGVAVVLPPALPRVSQPRGAGPAPGTSEPHPGWDRPVPSRPPAGGTAACTGRLCTGIRGTLLQLELGGSAPLSPPGRGPRSRSAPSGPAAAVSVSPVSVPAAGTPQPSRGRSPSAPALSVCPSVRRAGRAAASLRAVKVGVDARQPRRSCQALSLLAFPSLRPSLRGALLSRSPALRLFTPPGSAAAVRRGPEPLEPPQPRRDGAGQRDRAGPGCPPRRVPAPHGGKKPGRA